jgi:tRNA dimethylallyltransferase
VPASEQPPRAPVPQPPARASPPDLARPAPASPPDPPSVLAIFGPTAVGKTALALALGERLRAAGRRPVAVSADALQVYRGLETITGVPTAAERASLEHRLVSFLPVDARFSVGEFARLAHAEIDGLLASGATPIVVGGTGLYLRAAIADLDLPPRPPDQVRARWEAELARRGPEDLHRRLAARAPWAADRIDPRDRSRVVRALELLDLGELEPPDGPSRLWTAETRHPTRLIGLVMERERLYAAIDARVDAMVARGAVAEVRAAQAAGASETARKALGFEELLRGDVDALKRRTRNLAKRQLTWMRKLAGVELVDVTGRRAGDVAAELLAAQA